MNFLKKNIGFSILCLFLLAGCDNANIMIEHIQNATTILVVITCFAVIIFVMWACLFKMKNQQAAVVVSSVLCCVVMIPLVISLNYYVEKRAAALFLLEEETKIEVLREKGRARILEEENRIAQLQENNKIKTLERQRLDDEVTKAKQSIEHETLNKKNILLERARLQLTGFQQITELALTQANFKYNLVMLEPTTPLESGWNIHAESFQNEVLVISSYDINAKFGIDLKEVKVVKTDNNSVMVSGIHPKFIGTDKWERNNLVKEIRRVDYKYGEFFKRRILDARQDGILADLKEQEYDREFSQRVNEGMELAFMDDVIIQLARNFIKIVLAPIYDNIVFDNIERPQALSLMEYLAKELDEEKYNLLKINEPIKLNLDLLEENTAELEADLPEIDTPELETL